jgi:flagellar basal-body rod protein FlgG
MDRPLKPQLKLPTTGVMNRGLYVAASGMLAMQARQDQLSNDLANAATPGYKPDRSAQRATFENLLVENVAGTAQVGTLAGGVRLEEQTTDLRAAPLRQTDEPLDLAVDGEGYFGVRTADGVRYTRNGQFATGPGGMLVDQQGNQVLGRDGNPARLKADNTVDPASVGVFALNGPEKAGDGRFTGTATGQATGVLRTGALETSGVDAARTMVEMMASLRAYEAGQKALTTIDDTLGRAAQLGTIR